MTPDPTATLKALRHWMPVQTQNADLSAGKIGLILIDPVVGFTLEGLMSDPASMQPMISAIDTLAKDLLTHAPKRTAVYIFRDHHGPDQIEPPYPPHCQEGSGEELIDPRLRWLEDDPRVTVFGKDCINGMIGALTPQEDTPETTPTYRHHFAEWVVAEEIDHLLVVGDCTDICDLDFVVSALSARNHGMFGPQRAQLPIMVYEPACATYHMPDPASLGLPETAKHDAPLTHHAALYFMQARGALIIKTYHLG